MSAGRIVPVGELPERSTITTDLPVPESALAIGAHPDDIEFGCGATLAKWAAAGCRLHHLVLTDGSKGTWDAGDDMAALVATRHLEQLEAAQVLGGGDVTFLDWPDGELEDAMPQRRQVCQVIRQVRPEAVLAHDPWRRYRLHPDHRHAGWLAVDALVAARDPKFFEDLGLDAHRPSLLLLWEADDPNHVEDVRATAEIKLAALLTHRSQHRSTMGIDGATEGADTAFRSRMEAQLAAHGALAGFGAGEAFHLIVDL
ncbi:MAG TPA: PIG-L deacetylase family protein [Acidimicrobiales bacterium]|nr:PIG-L deacetylase family protein [Acidimicrobiales bacterium]